MSESGPPTRKFQPGDEIERPHGWSGDRDYYVLGYTRAGKVVVENGAGTLFGVWAEDDLDPKRSLEGILQDSYFGEGPGGPVQRTAQALRDAGCIKDGW